MAEFTELPIAAGPLVPRVIYNELLNAINNRRAVVLPDATAAFTIHNTAGDATSATVEIDTAADEIYLIVVGGADASNTTLDLTLAAHDTITELVAVINALGFSWVAVEKSGAQTAHAGNDSDTLLSLGPADCLGVAHITWFTNYAPNGVMVGELYEHIVAYRAAIDGLASSFYVSVTMHIRGNAATTAAVDKSLSDVGNFAGYDFTGKVCNIIQSTGGLIGNRTIASNTDDKLIFTVSAGNGAAVRYDIFPATYTANTLHNAAFGDNNWDAAGAPYLTPPCLPHKNLWNDMKLCLDLLKWVRIDRDYANPVWTGKRWEGPPSVNANFAIARAGFFAGLIEHATNTTTIIGQLGQSSLAGGDYTVIHYNGLPAGGPHYGASVVSGQSFQTGMDLTIAEPSVVDGYFRLYQLGGIYAASANRWADHIDINIYIEGVKANSVAEPISIPRGTLLFERIPLDDISTIGGLNLDNTNNDMELRMDGLMTADPGASWATSGAFTGGFWGVRWEVYLELSWA